MMHDDEGGGRPFAAGLLIGALVGAGIALLFAPQSGEETRRLIRKKSRRIASGAQDRYEDVKDRIKKARKRAEEALSD